LPPCAKSITRGLLVKSAFQKKLTAGGVKRSHGYELYDVVICHVLHPRGWSCANRNFCVFRINPAAAKDEKPIRSKHRNRIACSEKLTSPPVGAPGNFCLLGISQTLSKIFQKTAFEFSKTIFPPCVVNGKGRDFSPLSGTRGRM
jgi:hypothetical protein